MGSGRRSHSGEPITLLPGCPELLPKEATQGPELIRGPEALSGLGHFSENSSRSFEKLYGGCLNSEDKGREHRFQGGIESYGDDKQRLLYCFMSDTTS